MLVGDLDEPEGDRFFDPPRAVLGQADILQPTTNRLSVSGAKFTKLALEKAGIPVYEMPADMVDAAEWSHERMVDDVAQFLKERTTAAQD